MEFVLVEKQLSLLIYIIGVPFAEPHVASNVRYIAFAMRIFVVLTPCKQGAVLSRYS